MTYPSFAKRRKPKISFQTFSVGTELPALFLDEAHGLLNNGGRVRLSVRHANVRLLVHVANPRGAKGSAGIDDVVDDACIELEN
jgi:hypothetical protein